MSSDATAALTQSIMNDMADAGDIFDLADERELEIEIRKRVSTAVSSIHWQERP